MLPCLLLSRYHAITGEELRLIPGRYQVPIDEGKDQVVFQWCLVLHVFSTGAHTTARVRMPEHDSFGDFLNGDTPDCLTQFNKVESECTIEVSIVGELYCLTAIDVEAPRLTR
jgi:hypothetical protein